MAAKLLHFGTNYTSFPTKQREAIIISPVINAQTFLSGFVLVIRRINSIEQKFKPLER